MQSELVKEINIHELQPTDIDLSSSTRDYYSNTFPLLEMHDRPEIWILDGQMYIADGHHQIHDRINNQGKQTIYATCYTTENCGVGEDIHAYIISVLLEKANQARKLGIRHINDLPISTE